ncbi:hypothetical protein CO046_02550 [Candidatus Peregrinibacteria bacterium CG_4_9_14_0_2_um_filter_53_11]|nr:MAG: hypothetical protein CO046_02550 [Candidatus Peregrinibacteria bacterium CG_4_9_14_0_2_um_filter_53_11]
MPQLADKLIRDAGLLLKGEGNLTTQLFEPATSSDLLADEPLTPQRRAALTETILVNCRLIGDAVEKVLAHQPQHVEGADRLAAAHLRLNECELPGTSTDPDGRTIIDRLQGAYTRVCERMAAVFQRLSESAECDDEATPYIFDLRLGTPEYERTLAKDVASVLESAHHDLAPLAKAFLGLVRATGGTDLNEEFERRNDEYRDEVSEATGLSISAALSGAKLLADDFKGPVREALTAEQCDPEALSRQLAVHYFQTLEAWVDPVTRVYGNLEAERNNPGELGVSYHERLHRYLDLFSRMIVVTNMTRRTLQLLTPRDPTEL